MALVVALGACSAAPTLDREKAVRDMQRDDPRLTRSQAECVVDRVVRELGSKGLGAEAAPEMITRRTGIRIDCVGVSNLGTLPPGSVPRAPTSVGETEPRSRGDDTELDRLHDSCAAGSGIACDTLFEMAPVGSDDELFASTCGGRTKETNCAAVYPG